MDYISRNDCLLFYNIYLDIYKQIGLKILPHNDYILHL